jgi:hypothetical protein
VITSVTSYSRAPVIGSGQPGIREALVKLYTFWNFRKALWNGKTTVRPRFRYMETLRVSHALVWVSRLHCV